MHDMDPPMLHRDLKSLNLLLKSRLVNEACPVSVKVTDFGISRQVQAIQTNWATQAAGTYHWMAPEVVIGQNYNIEADIYSLGIVFWEIFSRKKPYVGIPVFEFVGKVCMEGLRPNLNDIQQDTPNVDQIRWMIS